MAVTKENNPAKHVFPNLGNESIKPFTSPIAFIMANKLVVGILFFFSFALYANTIGGDYALDDGIVILENNYTKLGFSGIPKILLSDSFEGFLGGKNKLLPGGRYRPLSIITFAAEYGLWGAKPAISHCINALLFGVSVVALFIVLANFMLPLVPSLATALLFAAHPIHTEAVANIKGRDEVLSFLFIVLTLYHVFRYLHFHATKDVVLASVHLFIALLAKENGLTLLAIIPLTAWFFCEKETKKHLIPLTATTFFTIALYFLLRFGITGFDLSVASQDILNNPFVDATFNQKYATIIWVLLRYIGLLFVPYPLSFDYGWQAITYAQWSDLGVIASVLVHIAILIVAILGGLKRKIWAYAILFYLFSIAIVSNIPVNIGAFMADRLLYQASLGFCILGGLLIGYLYKRYGKGLAFGILAIVLLPASAWTLTRNTHWHSNYKLYSRDVQHYPMSAKANKARAEVLIGLVRNDSIQNTIQGADTLRLAITHLRKALTIHSRYTDALLDLGTAYFYLDEYDSTKKYWAIAKQIEPQHSMFKSFDVIISDNNISNSYLNKGLEAGKNKNFESAIKNFKMALRYNPNNADAHYNAGLSYGSIAKMDSAVYHLQEAVRLAPDKQVFWYNLGGALYSVHQYDKARHAWEQSLKLKPNDPETQRGLAALQSIKR